MLKHITLSLTQHGKSQLNSLSAASTTHFSRCDTPHTQKSVAVSQHSVELLPCSLLLLLSFPFPLPIHHQRHHHQPRHLPAIQPPEHTPRNQDLALTPAVASPSLFPNKGNCFYSIFPFVFPYVFFPSPLIPHFLYPWSFPKNPSTF